MAPRSYIDPLARSASVRRASRVLLFASLNQDARKSFFLPAQKWLAAKIDRAAAAGYAKERDVLGEDPYAYVIGANERRTLGALNRYQIEQHLLKTMLPMDELFIVRE
ncbi:MAG TPA: hypothetical protein VN826_10120 [Candidatus Eisenbacteria bacterium]|nr:hypothetical protein [Candidatus Eisenbacteria bacterium]